MPSIRSLVVALLIVAGGCALRPCDRQCVTSPEGRALATTANQGRPHEVKDGGPTLTWVAAKPNPEWLARWIRETGSYRADTRMPGFFAQPLASGG